jgi:hypothetical protein
MILRSRCCFGWNLNAVQPPAGRNSSLDGAQFFSRVTISNGTDAGGAKSGVLGEWRVEGLAMDCFIIEFIFLLIDFGVFLRTSDVNI